MSRSESARAWQPPPGLILSGRPFLGVSSLSKEADFHCLVRFANPENTAALVTAAVHEGLGAIALVNDVTLLRALDLATARCRFQVYPIIPNMIGYVRDATDYGMVGAGLRRLRRLAAADLLRIGLRGLVRARRVLARDFSTVLSVLIDVEMAAFKKFRPPMVLLHSQVTDLAVALGNREALGVFADVIRRRFGAEPGLATNNFGTVLPALTRWGLDIRVVVAPFNATGFLMKPTRQACESLLSQTDKYVIADRITTGDAASLAGAFGHLRHLGIRSAVVDVAETAALKLVTDGHRQAG